MNDPLGNVPKGEEIDAVPLSGNLFRSATAARHQAARDRYDRTASGHQLLKKNNSEVQTGPEIDS